LLSAKNVGDYCADAAAFFKGVLLMRASPWTLIVLALGCVAVPPSQVIAQESSPEQVYGPPADVRASQFDRQLRQNSQTTQPDRAATAGVSGGSARSAIDRPLQPRAGSFGSLPPGYTRETRPADPVVRRERVDTERSINRSLVPRTSIPPLDRSTARPLSPTSSFEPQIDRLNVSATSIRPGGPAVLGDTPEPADRGGVSRDRRQAGASDQFHIERAYEGAAGDLTERIRTRYPSRVSPPYDYGARMRYEQPRQAADVHELAPNQRDDMAPANGRDVLPPPNAAERAAMRARLRQEQGMTRDYRSAAPAPGRDF
jgi:hypothetical protein